MRFHIPHQVVDVCRALQSAGHQAFVVGGAVRSLLIQQADPAAPGPKDYDVTTSAQPKQVQGIFPRTIPTGIDHGTVTVLAGDLPVEVTTFRMDGAYSDGRRPDSVLFVGDLTADLERRDFTINAIAYDPVGALLHDPLGGQADITAGIIRAVGDPKQRFTEDGLRLLRAVRFAAQLNFALDFGTFMAAAQCSDLIKNVSRERVRDELLKILESKRASYALGVMSVTGLLRKAFGSEMHRALETSGTNLQWDRVLEDTPQEHKLAAFLWPLKHNPAEARRVVQSLKLPSAHAQQALEALFFPSILAMDDPKAEARFGGPVAIRKVLAVYPEKVVDGAIALQLAELQPRQRGDTLAVFRDLVAEERRKNPPLKIRDLAINGEILAEMGVKRGPRMGQILAALMERVLCNPELNDRDVLISLVMEMEPIGEAP